MDLYCRLMSRPWVHGFAMGVPWVSHGFIVLAHRSPTDLPWVCHVFFGADPWVLSWVLPCIFCAGLSYGVPMGFKCWPMGHPWDSYGPCMRLPGVSRGSRMALQYWPMARPRVSHGFIVLAHGSPTPFLQFVYQVPGMVRPIVLDAYTG